MYISVNLWCSVMNKRALAIAVILLTSSIIVVGLLGALGKGDVSDSKLYTYPLSVVDKTFIVTVETNWNAELAPEVSLLNSSDPNETLIGLYFRGITYNNITTWETITYNITIPIELLGEDISLIRKYSPQDPSRYILSSNSTHNSLQMTFDYSPFFSGSGYFIIKGTEEL